MAGSIFISYRRENAGWAATSLHGALARNFDEEKLFLDVDSIPPGEDFAQFLTDKVKSADCLLAVIGPGWADVENVEGEQRLANPGDYVRVEIEAALDHDIRVIPVLVDGAKMPKADELPETLRPLSRRQAVLIDRTRFNNDARKLADDLARLLGVAPRAEEAQPAPAPQASAEVPPTAEPQAPAEAMPPAPPGRWHPTLGEPWRNTRPLQFMLVWPMLMALIGTAGTVLGIEAFAFRGQAPDFEEAILVGAPAAFVATAIALVLRRIFPLLLPWPWVLGPLAVAVLLLLMFLNDGNPGEAFVILLIVMAATPLVAWILTRMFVAGRRPRR